MSSPRVSAFNGPVEIGLRALVLLAEVWPQAYSIQRLIICDYLIVHSDDVQGGPIGLHPQTPHRGSELLVRRTALQAGLLLYESRGLVERQFQDDGVFYTAGEGARGFLDALESEYVGGVEDRARWVAAEFGEFTDGGLEKFAADSIGKWGAEFSMESILWADEPE